jgi:2-dehydro-3-deoxyphosphooctonate aldolase (KDO 8-P synthase)
MRALPIRRQFAPVIFDVTYSSQMTGGREGVSDGQREYGPYLARAAAAVGVDGFFIETHPNPLLAWSDSSTMIPLDEMPSLLESLLTVRYTSRPFVRLLS